MTTETRRDADLEDMDSFQMISTPSTTGRTGSCSARTWQARVRRAGARPGRAGAELGWQLGGADQPVTDRLDGRVPDSVAHAAVWCGAADLGRDFQRTSSAPASGPTGRRSSVSTSWEAVISRRTARAGAGVLAMPRSCLTSWAPPTGTSFRDRRSDTTVRSAATPSSG